VTFSKLVFGSAVQQYHRKLKAVRRSLIKVAEINLLREQAFSARFQIPRAYALTVSAEPERFSYGSLIFSKLFLLELIQKLVYAATTSR
jgi:hypothetical protein